MEIINDKGEIRKVFKSLMDRHRKYFWVARFARSTFPFIFDLADHESKIFKIAVGLNGLETSPTFINEFFDCKAVRYFKKDSIPNDIDLFLFYTSETNWDLLFGTITINKDSFDNIPQFTYHTSAVDDINGTQLVKTFEAIDQIWSRTFEISEEEYEEYWEKWSKDLTSQE